MPEVLYWDRMYALRLLALLLFLPALHVMAAPLTELQKIDALLERVEKMDAVFVRNGKDYSGHEAAEHLRYKIKSAQSSFFGISKDKWTAELFIEKIASKSSVSKKPYLIKFKDGNTRPAGEYLTEQLKEITTGK